MNYQSLVERIGLGLAHQIMEGSLADFQFDKLTLSEEREIYQAERNRNKRSLIVQRIISKSYSLKDLLLVLGPSGDITEGRRQVLSKILALNPSFGQLKKVYTRLCEEDLKITVVSQMLKIAKTVEQLNEAYQRIVLKSHLQEGFIVQYKSTEDDNREYKQERQYVLTRMVMVNEQNPLDVNFHILIPLVMYNETLRIKLLESLKTANIPFGKLYKLLEVCSAGSCFSETIIERLEQVTPSLEDMLEVFATYRIHGSICELMVKKIKTGNFSLRDLATIYSASNGAWSGVNDAVIEKIKTLLED